MGCYFGSYFYKNRIAPPFPVILLLGASIFVGSVFDMGQALQFALVIMQPRGEKTPRTTCVSESVMFTILLFMITCILFIFYLMPIAFQVDFPLGGCEMYSHFFKSACSNAGH